MQIEYITRVKTERLNQGQLIAIIDQAMNVIPPSHRVTDLHYFGNPEDCSMYEAGVIEIKHEPIK